MSIGETIRQGLHYAHTCKWLWLFGFFVGATTGGSSGGPGGGQGGSGGAASAAGAAAAAAGFGIPTTALVLIGTALLIVIISVLVMRFISEGALIEGVVRARHGGAMTTREAFRAGWAHWGVLLRIAVLYVAATVGSLVVLGLPWVLALRAGGWPAAVAVGIPAILIGMPWLVTLFLVQAFASRIAVLENRHALDALAKARLFLHGRLMLGLRLIVATFAGTLLIVFVGLIAVVPMALLLVALVPILRLAPVLIIGGVVLLPVVCVLTAVLGTFRSSIWTIGYLTQVES